VSRSEAQRIFRQDVHDILPPLVLHWLCNCLKRRTLPWDDVDRQYLYGEPQYLGLADQATSDIAVSIKNGDMSVYIGPGTVVAGALDYNGSMRIVGSKGIMRIDGQLIGDLSSTGGILVVSKWGEISGQVSVAYAAIDGTIRGSITATKLVEIGRSATIIGNIQSPSLLLDYGATLSSDQDVDFRQLLKVNGRLKAPQISSRRGTVVVGANGEIHGHTQVAMAVINGALRGDVVASKRVVLGPSALIEGDVQSPILQSWKGAVVSGNFFKTSHQALQ
jgi:cytoskeletal protein CcmA (bactofilin family)